MCRRPRSGITERSPFFAEHLPRVFAHRGLALGIPENTLLAFVRALGIGVAYVETDVHATRDGVAVISHDPDLRRLAGRSERIRDLTMRELADIDLGEGQTFVSLAEALDAFPLARFNIDIKVADAALPTMQAVAHARAERRVLIASFNASRRRRAAAGLPGVATSASAVASGVAVAACAIGVVPLARLTLRNVDAVQLPERVRGVRIITARTVRRLHAAGAEVHVWTVNDPEDMHRLLDLGVDGLVTDRADIALEVVRARGEAAGPAAG